VSNGTADCAVVPYENSISGVISSTIVHLLTHPTLHIVGEILDADELCLCAPANATLSSIRTVLSHSAILLQAHTFVDSLASKNGGATVKGQPTFDSASACAEIGGDVTKAAIASRRAAEIHGLVVLETNFADVESETRYIILSTTPAQSSHRLGRHCSVSYVLPNRPGAMFKSLSCFAFRDLSIIKVSTVPLGGKKELLTGGSSSSGSSGGILSRWDYAFVVDFVASANPEVNQAALNSLKEFAKSVRILGEYSPAEMKAESPSKSMMHLAAF
jgi:prephenate dehydratase